jgi:hypothetical protein
MGKNIYTVFTEEEAGELLGKGFYLHQVFQYKEYRYSDHVKGQVVYDVYLAYVLIRKGL